MKTADARQFLVPEIHPCNFWIFWALSFFAKVRVRVINAACSRWPSGQMQIVDPSQYFTADTATAFKAQVLVEWQKWLGNVPRDGWTGRCGDVDVDLAPKIKQELSRQFERVQFFKLMLRSEAGRGIVVESAFFRMLKQWDATDVCKLPLTPWLSFVNCACDIAWLRVLAIWFCARSVARVLVAAARPAVNRGALAESHIPILFDCDNPNEYNLSTNSRTFTWIVDNDIVTKRDVLFLLRSTVAVSVIREAEKAGYAATTLQLLYRHVPRGALYRCISDTLAIAGRLLLPTRGMQSLLVLNSVARAVELVPVYKRWQPLVYVESVSSHGIETPAIAYLKAMGVRCILYQMSGSYAFGHDGHVANDFRSIFYSHVLASEMVAWNSDQAAFYLSHPQDGLSINVLGPLMPGDESVMQAPPRVIRKRTRLKWDDDGRDHLYVVAFDVGAASWQHRLGRQSFKEFFTYPDCYDAKYNEAFVADIWRLVQTDERIRLIFKPKREPSAERFMYSAHEKSLLQRLEAHPQGFVLAENINPWAPLAIADLCVVLPLTSPGLAAMHYGIPVVYHDPLGVVRAHRQPFLASSMTHSFAELEQRVASVLAARKIGNDVRSRVCASGPGAAECLGRYPETNSSDAFRRGLLGLHVPAAVNADKEFVGVTGRA